MGCVLQMAGVVLYEAITHTLKGDTTMDEFLEAGRAGMTSLIMNMPEGEVRRHLRESLQKLNRVREDAKWWKDANSLEGGPIRI